MPASVYPALQSAVLLCIDDNEDALECEKSFLESSGYSVLTAASGGEGLELAPKLSADVVILDYFMPEMNPEQALKWVDAIIAKDCLVSQLLPAIPQLYGCGSNHSLCVTHNSGGAVYEDRVACGPEPERLSR